MAMASKTSPLPTTAQPMCRSCWANGAGSFSAATNFGVGTSPHFSSGGRFQWRWQARPRHCQHRLKQRIDLVTRLRSDADANADTHTNPHGYAYRHTDSDTNAHTYSHCPGDRPNNSRRSRVQLLTAPLTLRPKSFCGSLVQATRLPRLRRRTAARVLGTCGVTGAAAELFRTLLRPPLTGLTQRISIRNII